MTTLWIDAQAGVAGDMLLAALIDAGADRAAIEAGLRGVVPGRWTLATSEVRRGAFRALHARFSADTDARYVPVAGGPGRSVLVAGRGHTHGSWTDIRARLQRLPPRPRDRALAVYGRLVAAEAHLHGVPESEVHLHEVGSADAVLDVAGVCLALEELGIDALSASAVPLATGTVRAAHGDLPLPAPATLAVLRGWPVFPSAVPGEWVTPTGAALIAALATPGPPPAGTVGATGYGAGTRDPASHANLVRVLVLEGGGHAMADEVVELACNLDDQPAVTLAAVPGVLLAAGALDVWTAPVVMKKGRSAVVLHALVRPADADACADLILRHTTALGVRRSTWTRRILDRWFEPVVTPWGEVRVKVGGRDGRAWHAAPETDDVLAIAERTGVPANEVREAALAAWRATGAGTGR